MKSKTPPPINLPYSSTVASFFGDQGGSQGNSFLGRMFKGGGGRTVMNNARSAAPAAAPAVASARENGAFGRSGSDR